MAVEHAEAPRGEHEQPRAGEKYLDEPDRPFAPFAFEAVSDETDQIGRRQNSDEDKDGSDEREQGEDCSGDAACFPLVFVREQLGVDRDERSGERAFAEDVLEEVRDFEGGVEGVFGGGVAEVVGEDALADESDDATEKNPCADEKSVLARRALRLSFACGVRLLGGKLARRRSD